MEKITWTSAYSVGVEKLDNQHKTIIDLINRLVASPSVSVHSETIFDLLSEMLDYSKEHLEFEESLLRENNYPELEQHITHHHFYLEKIGQLSMATMDYENNIPTEILSFLKEWWQNHILEEDMKFKPFFIEKGIA